MRTIHIYRSLPLNADSRIARYQLLFKNDNVIYHTWEDNPRENSTSSRISFFLSKGGSRLEKLFKFILFQFWTLKVFLESDKLSVHVFMDVDTCLITNLFFSLRSVYVDIVDPIACTKFVKLTKYRLLIDSLETSIAVKADHVIFPHEIRLDYYHQSNQKKFKSVYFIENVPSFSNVVDVERVFTPPLTIGYFGTLDANVRGLEWLADFAISYESEVRLVIGGRGALKNYFEGLALKYNNIFFQGPFKHADLPKLLSEVNFYWSYYSKSVELHKYAIPNKFYEHLQLDIPIIVSSIIPQCKEIRRLDSGIILEDLNDDEMERLFREIKGFAYRSGHIRMIGWNAKYLDYYSKIMLK